ncbi:MAG TPA: PKD domain-containing protein, partial [Cytophagaceae bacterium]
GNIAVYSNTMQVRNVANNSIRDLRSGADNTCGGSATGGGVMIPDPARPHDTYYLFIANDVTGGNCGNKGINYYKFRKNGGVVTYLSGPTNLIASPNVDESICAGSDGNGNYWIASHDQASNKFKLWNVTAGGVSARADQAIGPSGVVTGNSYIKISPCQDKIAWHGGTQLVVYAFDRATGTIGAELGAWGTAIHGIGLEFSPNGNTIYVSGMGTEVKWYTIGGGSGTIAGSGSWSMQLGPDGKIYTSPGGNSIGVINNPNNPATTTYGSVSLGSGSTFRGLSNIAWLNPNKPEIDTSIAGCKVDFNHLFKNYYNTNIGVNNGSFNWNFGDGKSSTSVAPSHTYDSDGTYNVTVTFKDATCGHTWSASTSVEVDCSMPVSWLRFDGEYKAGSVILEWATASEINNSHFLIERSIDGISFTPIGRVEGSGTTSDFRYYKYIDNSPVFGKAYYRLRQVDFDESADLSNIIEVNANSSIINVVPNPSKENFTISISGAESATIYVTDVLGKLVFEATSIDELKNITFGDDLPEGTYLLNVITQDTSYTEKLIKE